MITTTTTANKLKSKVISYSEFERISAKFPECPVAKFQASIDESFGVEWVDGRNYPSRLIHNFKPIFC